MRIIPVYLDFPDGRLYMVCVWIHVLTYVSLRSVFFSISPASNPGHQWARTDGALDEMPCDPCQDHALGKPVEIWRTVYVHMYLGVTGFDYREIGRMSVFRAGSMDMGLSSPRAVRADRQD